MGRLTFIFDEAAVPPVVPERLEHTHVGIEILVTHELLNMLGSLLAIVCISSQSHRKKAQGSGRLTERDLREVVVDDVPVRDSVHEELALPSEEVAIDCGSSAASKRPDLVLVVWRYWVGVVEEGHEDDPVAHAEPGKQ